MLISTQALLDAIVKRRCVRSGRRLEPHEHLLSSKEFPHLYSEAECSEDNRRFISEVLLKTIENARHALSDEHATPVSKFLRSIVALARPFGKTVATSELRERFLHLYLFLHWGTIRFNDCIEPRLDIKFYEGQGNGSDNPYETRLLPLLVDHNAARPDIVGIDLASKTLYLIEVKPAQLDDRGVGQIHRYFHLAHRVLNTADHKCDIRFVRPVIICGEVPASAWYGFEPGIFEVTLFLGFRASVDEFELRDLRRIGRNAIRDRTKYLMDKY